jgi:hypothetical protein
LKSVKRRGYVPEAVLSPLPKNSYYLLLAEQRLLDFHLSLEGTLYGHIVSPTGSAAPEPGFSFNP